MSEKLMNGLVTTKRELEAGLADAEAELARTEEYSRKLEELIAVGRATLHAASQLNFQTPVQRPAGVRVNALIELAMRQGARMHNMEQP